MTGRTVGPDDAAEIDQDRRHERFLIRVTVVALVVVGLFLVLRQALG